MNEITHPQLVNTLVKPGAIIREELTAEDCHLLHMTVGVAGEAGELLDAIKKSVIYRKPLDRANVIEELGDIEFYMEGIRQELEITREETLQANIDKLSKRYSDLVYSDQSAQDRADKEDEGDGVTTSKIWHVDFNTKSDLVHTTHMKFDSLVDEHFVHQYAMSYLRQNANFIVSINRIYIPSNS